MASRMNRMLAAGFFWGASLNFVSCLWAQTDSPEPAVPSSSASSDDEGDKPFVPHWSGQLELSRSAQPSPQGGGQTTTDLGVTGTYNMDKEGNFIQVGAVGGSQKVEGSQSAYGSLSLEGGLGLGIFSPSLVLEGQYGQAQLKTTSAALNLDFLVSDPLTLGFSLGGGFQGHQGPVSQLTGTVNTKTWTAGLNADFQAFDDLAFTACLQQQTDITYQYQYVAASQTTTVSVNKTDRIPSLTLGVDWTFVKNFTLEGTGQFGQEFYPAGTFYSPILAETVTYTQPTTKNFAGYGLSLIWNFL